VIPASDYQAARQTAWPHSRRGFATWPRTLVNLRPEGALFAAVAVGIAVGPADSRAQMTRMPAWRRPGPGGPPVFRLCFPSSAPFLGVCDLRRFERSRSPPTAAVHRVAVGATVGRSSRGVELL
jgi:hypothetical protein